MVVELPASRVTLLRAAAVLVCFARAIFGGVRKKGCLPVCVYEYEVVGKGLRCEGRRKGKGNDPALEKTYDVIWQHG